MVKGLLSLLEGEPVLRALENKNGQIHHHRSLRSVVEAVCCGGRVTQLKEKVGLHVKVQIPMGKASRVSLA